MPLRTSASSWRGRGSRRARRRLLRELDEFVLEGVHNNLAFQRWLASHPEFIAGHLSTTFLDDHFDTEAPSPGRATVWADG